jgi:hypothetical protein
VYEAAVVDKQISRLLAAAASKMDNDSTLETMRVYELAHILSEHRPNQETAHNDPFG